MAFFSLNILIAVLFLLPLASGGSDPNPVIYSLSDYPDTISEVSRNFADKDDGLGHFLRETGISYFWDDTNHSLSCEEDLQGFGSLETECTLNASVSLKEDSFIIGGGSLKILANVSLHCPICGCTIGINISGNLMLDTNASVVGGTVIIDAANVRLAEKSSINTTALGGGPPAQTSGTPLGVDGAGGGHGGRGACCVKGGSKDQEDMWGGDVYSWSTLPEPWSYGSQGGTTNREEALGGGGGGRIFVVARTWLDLNGTISADGGSVSEKGGGGSGGSIRVQAPNLNGTGEISAAGGTGLAGGGGGRVAIESTRQEGVTVSVHGGHSLGCPKNAGAAGTRFDVVPQSLIVSNGNRTTETDTLLLEFPTYPLWANVYVESCAKVAIPLLWSRVQVRSQIALKDGGILSFGLAHYPFSEFELVADEVEMTDSTMKVYGALRLAVKVLLMWNSVLQIDGGGDIMVATSTIDASNFILLRHESVIISNSNLGVHGQGFFKLNGSGDTIKAQRLFLSLFYNINVGEGAVLQAPLDEVSVHDGAPTLYCDNPTCPVEVIQPPEDCNLNTSLPFTLQICRVEDVVVDGLVRGSVVHIHRARTVTVNHKGLISASGLGCKGGIGKGVISRTGAGGGGGHGGRGGKGFFNGDWAEGGKEYGSRLLPCELGSGSGNSTSKGANKGGGVIVVGSLEHPLSIFNIFGALTADGESHHLEDTSNTEVGGIGGGSGGSLLFFLQSLTLGNGSLLSIDGGHGCPVGGGGGGGGRVHFHWANIATGEDFVAIANIKGSISTRGGTGSEMGGGGANGTLTGKACPNGLYGVFCVECPVGTYKNENGSSFSLCKPCSPERLPRRAEFTYVRGGATDASCPYKCVSDKFRMPHCYTPLEELIYAFGGPWLFGFLLSGLLVILALVLSVARMKFIGTDDFSGPAPTPQGGHIDHSLPFLESLNEVLETTRVEESQSHVHRMYFMGCNSFSEPWHLPHSPPAQIMEIIYEDAFNRFVDEINCLAAYQWWEGSVHGILSVVAYPVAWSWQQWRRRKKVQRLREYVRSEYDHACLRSCRSRALYEGLKVAATPDLMLAYVDFFLGGDEKRPDLPPRLLQRFPLSIAFGGDGRYMAPYSLHSDNLLTSLLGQAVPATMWYRMVAGLNAQLRTVRQGCLRSNLLPVVDWLNTHANPRLCLQGVRVDLAWFQATASGYFQLGLVVNSASNVPQPVPLPDLTTRLGLQEFRSNNGHMDQPLLWQGDQQPSHANMSRRRIGGGVIDSVTLRALEDKKDIFFPLSLILHNVRPIGHQDLVGLIISILLLGDFSLTLLTLLQFYSISLPAFLVVLLVLPLASLLPFPAGINALFSHGPRRSAGLARFYALWNVTSLTNVVIALFYGFIHYKVQASSNGGVGKIHALNFTTEESGWWLFPTALLVCKCIQARMVDRHIANLELQDRTLYSKDPTKFWES